MATMFGVKATSATVRTIVGQAFDDDRRAADAATLIT
jgi:hypothetical protein